MVNRSRANLSQQHKQNTALSGCNSWSRPDIPYFHIQCRAADNKVSNPASGDAQLYPPQLEF